MSVEEWGVVRLLASWAVGVIVGWLAATEWHEHKRGPR